MQLEIRDRQGVKILHYDEAVKYHGGFHVAGVALAWKFLEGALSQCCGALSRDDIQLTLGATPPGVTDCLEYATRALSRRRAIVEPGFMGGPEVCCGSLSFALTCGKGKVLATVRDDALPKEFVDTAVRIDAGLASDKEIEEWRETSLALSSLFLAKDPEELFLITREGSLEESRKSGKTDVAAYPPADYNVTELPPLKVQDENGVTEIRLEEMIRFHDKDHFAGVVLAYKLLSMAFDDLWGDEIPHRKDITILSGLNPPGLIDGFEYVARAVSRQRHCLIASGNGAPLSPFGKFVFQVSNGDKHCALKLRQGLLPEDFASIGRKAEAGLADAGELARWESYKHGIGIILAGMDVAEILETA
jgi:hypothetical protein